MSREGRTISSEQAKVEEERGVQIDRKRNRAVAQEEVQYSDDETKDTHNNLVLRSKRYECDYSAAASTTYSLQKKVRLSVHRHLSMHVARVDRDR